MNGFKNGTVVAETPFANYYFIVIAIDVVCLLADGTFVTLVILRFKKEKKAKTIA
jgi:hypothetical protein